MSQKCLVGYARAHTSYGHSYGERFDRLEECCDRFKIWFFSTGNPKSKSFNSPWFQERSGINIITRGVLSLVLRLDDPCREDHLKFCPFCGAEIELKCTKSVELKPKTKEVPDGYEEIVKWQEPDQPARIKSELTHEQDIALLHPGPDQERLKKIGDRIDKLSEKR